MPSPSATLPSGVSHTMPTLLWGLCTWWHNTRCQAGVGGATWAQIEETGLCILIAGAGRALHTPCNSNW